jgi:GNAT superfamily N-acetyltransferase
MITLADVLRDYEAAWAETQPQRRDALLASCLAQAVEIVGPGYRLRGRQAVSDDVVRFHRERPGWRAVVTSGVDAHSGWARFGVAVKAADGTIAESGVDIAELAPDGRFARIVSFWGALPALPASAALQAGAGDGVALEVHDELPADAVRAVDDGLGAANEMAAPVHEVRRLGCFARLPSGEVIGGAVGRTWGACCELQQLWVDARHRKGGIGSRLLRLFEQGAAARGCRTFYLDTFSFQAPAFYRLHGYESRLDIRGYSDGIVKHTMVREF